MFVHPVFKSSGILHFKMSLKQFQIFYSASLMTGSGRFFSFKISFKL